MPLPEARFAVLMFTDIVKSTDLKKRHGMPAYTTSLQRHNALFEGIARGIAGMQIIKFTGDGYYASFTGVAEAVRFALLFQHTMRREPWTSIPLITRVGIHAGEITDTEILGQADVLGPASDLTARVMSLAVGGQILLTRTPFDEARPFVREHPSVDGEAAPALLWPAHGPYSIQGLDEPIEIFEVGAEGLAPLTPPPDSEKAKRAIRPGEEETLGWRPGVGLEVPGRAGWLLVERLGAGGFGEVWIAEHARLRDRRAFKFCFDDERLRALKREVTLTRLLRTALGERDDIVRIFELKLDEPPFYLESEVAPEGNILQWAERQGGLAAVPLATRLELLAATATALAAAHSVGVLHKDIKPSNVLIFLDESGAPRPRLVDFGIGTLADSAVLAQFGVTGMGFTQLSQKDRGGTPFYRPPEYLAGRPYTVQGDIYGLGVMLYQMVIADAARPLAPGWERNVPDEFLRADIAACVDGDPTRRLPSATDLATRLRSLDSRRSDEETRLAEESRRLGFVITGVILMLFLILGGIAFGLRKAIPLMDGNTARLIVINTFSLLDLMSAFICVPLFLSVLYRYFQATRRSTDLIFSFLLLQIVGWSILIFTLDNVVPEGAAAGTIPRAAEATLLLYRLMYVLGLSILPAMTHFALRYSGTDRFSGWKALQLYALALALSPICWAESFLRIRTQPLQDTSSLLCAAPFQPFSEWLVLPYSAVWLGVNIYVQWLLWPHRRIQEGEDSGKMRINTVWIGIFCWGLTGVVEIILAAIAYAGVDPDVVLVTVAMIALAVGLAREAARPEAARAEMRRRLQSQTAAALVR